MADEKWTVEQKKAIETDGNNLLVSAAAGAGKTAVLVERIIRKITQKDNHVDINKLLTVTFTNAAASEMKERVKNRLYELIEKQPDDLMLQRQFALIEKANITTIHSFCSSIVRDRFHILNLDSGFRPAEKAETAMIYQQTLDDLFERLYDDKEIQGFITLADTYGIGRDDSKLKELISALYEFTRSCPDTIETLEKAVESYNRLTDDFEFSQTEHGKIIINHLIDRIEYIIIEMEVLIEETYDIDAFNNYRLTMEEDIKILKSILDKLISVKNNKKVWNDLKEYINSIKFSNLKSIRGEYDINLRDQIKTTRDSAKKAIGEMQERIFVWDNLQILDVIEKQYPLLKTMLETVRLLDFEYFNAKKKRGILDFSDLEHLALSLLQENTKDGRRPSKHAMEYSEKFEEILIDEYQDSNYVQEEILTSIASGHKNIFMVGDVKQSIYRFRQSMPGLFLDKYSRYKQQSDENDTPGILVKLYKNFRSQPNVIDSVNAIFERIMTGGLFEIDYTDDEKLICGNTINDSLKDKDRTEIVVIDTKNMNELFSDEEKPENCIPEARTVAKLINDMLATGYEIYDNKQKKYRKIEYNDCAVLTRVKTGWAEPFTKELNKLGVPAYCDISGGYYDTVEVNTVLSLLKIIDNPLQDIPLISVLLSPIGDFNEEELSLIRLCNRQDFFYKALLEYADRADKTTEKVRNFLENYKKWRCMAMEMPLDELVRHLYVSTGYIDYVSALPEGDRRNANLKILYEKARTLKNIGWNGLYDFLRFMEKSALYENDTPGTATLGENENVVRVMTVHKSKGLEFPIVFVCGCGKQFNLRTDFLVHHKFGLGIEYIDPEKRFSCNTLQKEALLIKHKEESLAEEMRVLYVAATRAKNRLFFIGCCKDTDKLINKCELSTRLGSKRVPQSVLLQSKSFLEWIMTAIWNRPKTHENAHGIINYDLSLFKLSLIQPELIMIDEKQEIIPDREVKNIDYVDYDNIKKILDWEYPYKEYAYIPAKMSVTELKKISMIDQEQNNAVLIEDDPTFKKPSFLTDDSEYKDFGSLVHYIFQHLDIEKIRSNRSEKFIINMIDEMTESMILSNIADKKQIQMIRRENIAAFFKTEPARKLLECDFYMREMPFYLRIDSDDYFALKGEVPSYRRSDMPPILIQGIIDLWFQDKEGITLIDFKTDRIFVNSDIIFKQRYGTQLSLYKRALEKITGQKTLSTHIYAVSSMRIITF